MDITSMDFANRVRILRCSETGDAIEKDSIHKDFRGEEFSIRGGRAPHKPSSAGFVHVHPVEERDDAGSGQEFYPSVFNMEWA